jgi:hypothetical protein
MLEHVIGLGDQHVVQRTHKQRHREEKAGAMLDVGNTG